MLGLSRMFGGIKPPDAKQASTLSQIRQAAIPPLLVLPVAQHLGQAASPCVRVGDRVLKGQIIARPASGLSVPLHASSSGRVQAIEPRLLPQALGEQGLSIVIATDGQDQAVEPQPLPDAFNQTPERLREAIQMAGIVGLGGAVFPTYFKLIAHQQPVATLILNGAECEPYISADDRLMRERAPQVWQGGILLAKALGAQQIWLAIEDNKPEALQALSQSLSELEIPAGLDLQLKPIPTRYPSGGAKQLIQILTGLQVPAGQRALDLGLQVQNVGTAYAVYRALIEGEPLISRITTLTGNNLTHQANLEVRLGTPVIELLHAQGLKRSGLPLIMGGPLMGFLLPSSQVPVVKATNCILAPAQHEWQPPGQERACIRCGDCQPACPVGLLPQQLYWYSKSENWEQSRQHHLPDCIECGACAYVCPSDIPLVQYFRFGKQQLQQQAQAQAQAQAAKARFDARNARLEQIKASRQARPALVAETSPGESGTATATDSQQLIAQALARAQAKKQAQRQAQMQETASPQPASAVDALTVGSLVTEPVSVTASVDAVPVDILQADSSAKQQLIAQALARAQAKKQAQMQEAAARPPALTETTPEALSQSSVPTDAVPVDILQADSSAKQQLIAQALARIQAKKQAQAQAQSNTSDRPGGSGVEHDA